MRTPRRFARPALALNARPVSGLHARPVSGPLAVLSVGLFALLVMGAAPSGTSPSGEPALPSGELTLLLELGGHPAGTVTLSREDRDYRYVSRHLFAVGETPAERVREGRYAVDAQGRTVSGAMPAGLWLWRRPAPGCVRGLEELDDVEGQLCGREAGKGALKGTLRGVPFTARHGADGQLSELELPGVRLRRLHRDEQVRASGALLDRLGQGIALPAGEGALSWSAEVRLPESEGTDAAPTLTAWSEAAARRLSREVDASFSDKRQGPADFDASRSGDARGGCLAHARRFVVRAAALGQRALVVHGLVAHEGALRPHAWVRVGLGKGDALELDPALGVKVTPDTHLRLGVQGEGAAGSGLGPAWWEVLNAARPVTRSCGAGGRRERDAERRMGPNAVAERSSSAVCAH